MRTLRPHTPYRAMATAKPKAGMTLVEVTVTAALFVVVFLASVALIHRDRNLSGQVLHTTHIELASQSMLLNLEHELANAYGERPMAIAPNGLTSGADKIKLDSTLGFPPAGTILIDRGSDSEERIAYEGLENTKTELLELERGADCTSAADHGTQAEVLWTGFAEPLAQQDPAPSASDYDGISMESTGRVYFRGDGIGFSYRVPVDPGGASDYLDGHDLKWGAEVPGVGATLDGWSALYFSPRTTFEESLHSTDINGDGDTVDVFDIGQIRRTTWDTSDAAVAPFDVGIGPAAILQERCNYGGDLDGDDFDDPLFLWDPWTNELHVRLFMISTSKEEAPVVRRIESVMFLRNEPEL